MSQLPFWTNKHERANQDEGRRDPLRAQVVLDALADALFKSADGPGLTSLTDHLGYLALHIWAKNVSREVSGVAEKSAYCRLIWQHAYLNWKRHKKDNKYSRFVVYGVNSLKDLSQQKGILPIPRWQEAPGKIVVLDPAARYENLCNSLNPKIAKKCIAQYADTASLKLLKQIARGYTDGILSTDKLLKVFDLSRLKRVRQMAEYLAKLPLKPNGLSKGLRPIKLGSTLKIVSSKRDALSPNIWTDKLISKPSQDGGVGQLLYRAALGRALVRSANWTFYDWAYKELGLQPGGNPQSPFDSVRKVKILLEKNTNDRDALFLIDTACEQAGTPFKLRKVIGCENQEELKAYVINCAKDSGKGFISNNGKPNKDLIEEFSGGYAGAMRLPQAWRFGKDITDAR